MYQRHNLFQVHGGVVGRVGILDIREDQLHGPPDGGDRVGCEGRLRVGEGGDPAAHSHLADRRRSRRSRLQQVRKFKEKKYFSVKKKKFFINIAFVFAILVFR